MADDVTPPGSARPDAVRREAGPAPDFALVRPYVESMGVPTTPARKRGRHSTVTADPPDATTELFMARFALDEPTAVLEPLAPRYRRRRVVIATAAVLIAVVALSVYFMGHSGGRPAPEMPAAQVLNVRIPTPRPSLSSDDPTSVTNPPPAVSTHAPKRPAPTHAPASPRATSTALFGVHKPGPTPRGTTGPTGQITGVGGLCIDDNGQVTPNGNAIQVFTCNGSPAQQWTVAADGTLRVLGKCLEVTKVVPGGLAELWDCDGSPSQVWRVGSSAELVNNASFGLLCLDDPNGTQTPGTRLQLWICGSHESGESWTLPAT